jgi:murein L,D-transpeptidase YafK
MRGRLGAISGLLVLVVAVLAYANWPVASLPPGANVDTILVRKGARELVLLRDGQVVSRYRVALGRNPVGPKEREGDGRTPEGSYVLDYRNPKSAFHLSLHVSYPNPEDSSRAAAQQVPPGSLIMVHGLRNGLGFIGRLHRLVDWTNGCIAVTNPEIEEIWRCVRDGTPIVIEP